MQSTSLSAYRNEIEPTLGERQEIVLEAIGRHRDITNSELKDYLGWEINTVTPRVKELRDKGLVRDAGTRVCERTGRVVHAWKLTGRIDTLF